MTDPRTPCIVGVAQRTYRPEDGFAPEPLEMWDRVCRDAAADCGGKDVLASVDSLRVIYSMSWQYDDAPARLAERLGLPDGDRFYSGVCGTTPQAIVSQAAEDILAGRCEMVLMPSGEALATKRRLKKQGEKPDWSFKPAEKRGIPFADPFHPAEIAHQVFQAYLTFAVFDIARRAHLGLSPEANRAQLGGLLAGLTEVAAQNPDSWFPTARSAAELTEVSAENRMISYPYTKNMVSIMDIDMAAAVLVTSHEKADALGIPQDRRIYLRGWGGAQDPVYVAERAEMWRSPAMQAASQAALAGAGIGVDDVAHLDLYSCFGSSLNFARDALGIAEADPRPLTVAGGLPYFGGPGNGYVSHALVRMVEVLREDAADCGMVSGVGMHMQNHVYGVYSATPGPVSPPDASAVQARASATPKREIANQAEGKANIAGYSVVHNREGYGFGVAVCDLPDGRRCYARAEEVGQMKSMEEDEWVGREVVLRDGGKGINLISA
jgi:acetyl-CoA C-acetyltransferase